MKKHILVVSQYFYPETFRINDMCQEWVKRGYKVTVITGIPNYPMGKTFEGYGLTRKRHEIWNGIEIYRIPLIPRGTSSLGMILNYLSFMISGIIAGKLKNVKADVVFSFEVSPMTQVLTGVSFAKRLKVPHLLYVQDLWPENVQIVTGINNKYIIGTIDKMVDYIYKNCNHIFATSPSFVKRLEERKSVFISNKSKVSYLPQYAEDFYEVVEKTELEDMPRDDNCKIVFTGNIGMAQGLDILPKAAALLKKDNVNCEFIIIGDGRYSEQFEKDIAEAGVEDMFFLLGRKKPEEVPYYLAWCDAAFISFANNQLFEMTIPAKLQSYMACGMPIIAAAGGETRRIVEEACCGYCCDTGSPKELVKIIELFVKEQREELFGDKAVKYYNEHFKKELFMEKLEGYLSYEDSVFN